MGIELISPDLPLVLDLAARFKLTAYDAAYLAVAGTLQCPLCTFDKRLAEDDKFVDHEGFDWEGIQKASLVLY